MRTGRELRPRQQNTKRIADKEPGHAASLSHHPVAKHDQSLQVKCEASADHINTPMASSVPCRMVGLAPELAPGGCEPPAAASGTPRLPQPGPGRLPGGTPDDPPGAQGIPQDATGVPPGEGWLPWEGAGGNPTGIYGPWGWSRTFCPRGFGGVCPFPRGTAGGSLRSVAGRCWAAGVSQTACMNVACWVSAPCCDC